jgi:hypothetical protein
MSCAVASGLFAVVAVLATWVLSGFDGETVAPLLRSSGGRFIWIGVAALLYFGYRLWRDEMR